MEEIVKYRKKVVVNLVLLLIISLISVFIILWGAKNVLSNGASIAMLTIFLIQIPVILALGFSGIRGINTYLEAEAQRQNNKTDEISILEKEVEDKAKEADDLSFNLNRLNEDIGNFPNWESFGNALLIGFSKQLEIVVGVVYRFESESKKFLPIANYAYYSDSPPSEFVEGDGLNGQVVKDRKSMFINELPDGYIKAASGLGSHKPKYLTIIPMIFEEQVVGVVELATFKTIQRGLAHKSNEISEFLGKKIVTAQM